MRTKFPLFLHKRQNIYQEYNTVNLSVLGKQLLYESCASSKQKKHKGCSQKTEKRINLSFFELAEAVKLSFCN